MTCPRSLGKLEEGPTLESAFPTHPHHQEREVGVGTHGCLGAGGVGTAAGQNRYAADLGLCNYFWVTHPFEKLTDTLASSSEKCVARTRVPKLQGMVGTATTDARTRRLEGSGMLEGDRPGARCQSLKGSGSPVNHPLGCNPTKPVFTRTARLRQDVGQDSGGPTPFLTVAQWLWRRGGCAEQVQMWAALLPVAFVAATAPAGLLPPLHLLGCRGCTCSPPPSGVPWSS